MANAEFSRRELLSRAGLGAIALATSSVSAVTLGTGCHRSGPAGGAPMACHVGDDRAHMPGMAAMRIPTRRTLTRGGRWYRIIVGL